MQGLVSDTPTDAAVFLNQKQLADFRANKPSDVISTLVSIYDSKDLFVKELQVLLAQRLLAVKDGNFEKEVRCCLLASPRAFLTSHVFFSAEISRS